MIHFAYIYTFVLRIVVIRNTKLVLQKKSTLHIKNKRDINDIASIKLHDRDIQNK